MHHPLRLLLYIEWILFAGVMALEVSPHPMKSPDRPVWLNIGVVVFLAVMGLRLPADRLSIKVIYTIAELMAIVLAGAMGMRPVGLLYIIVAIRSYLIFGRQYRVWITVGIFILSLIATNLRFDRHRSTARFPVDRTSPQERRWEDPPNSSRSLKESPRSSHRDDFRWGFVFMFGGILLSLQLLLDRMLAEKQAKEELAIANQRIRNYALRAEEIATLQERNRIAREIHDSLGHSLTALNLYLEMALKLANIQPDRSHEVLKEAKRLGSIALQDVRQSVSTLRSDPLHGEDLPIAIHKLVDEFQQSNQIKSLCDLDLPPVLPQDVATAIYRIVQEALTNISKYAGATEAIVKIQTTATTIELRIIDNGCGFNPAHNPTGFGLQGMRERVLSLQGKFEIIATPHQGCQIMAIIPLN
jgi:signal transduction histidine kinase